MKDIVLKFKNAILAGICISFGGAAYLTLGGWIGAVLFSFGLIVVIHNQHLLYTGTAGFVTKNNWIDVPISIIGNFIGCVVFGLILGYVKPSLSETADVIVNVRLNNGFIKNFLLAIFCGFVMTEAVYHAKFNNNKYLPLLFGIPLFIVCGYVHSIADIFYYSMATSKIIFDNIFQVIFIWIASLIGNFIGCNISNKRNLLNITKNIL